MRKIILVLLLISCLATAEKYALLVGINDYQGDISPLRYCVADVEAFAQALIETVGFKSDNVYLMTSPMTGRQQPTHVNVIRQLSLRILLSSTSRAMALPRPANPSC